MQSIDLSVFKRLNKNRLINPLDEEDEIKPFEQSSKLSVEQEKSLIDEKIVRERNKRAFLEEKEKSADKQRKIEEAKAQEMSIRHKAENDEKNQNWNRRLDLFFRMLKAGFLLLLLLGLSSLSALGIYYLYRLAFETPIIETKTVIKKVEKEVIPKECSQIRRNGQIYISCDGVEIKDVPTLADSGIKEIPELITEQ